MRWWKAPALHMAALGALLFGAFELRGGGLLPQKRRRETLDLATGLLLPVWDKLPEDHVQVIRIAATDGRSLLGREIPTAALGELGAKLGLELGLELPPEELAASFLRPGKPLSFAGPEPLTLRRSLVNGSQRLELAGFTAGLLH